MRLDIRYRTRFDYDAPVRESQNELRAAPMSDPRQLLISYRVTTTPASRVFSFTDYWGTRVDAFGVREPHESLEVVAEASVETRRVPMFTASPRIDSVQDEAFREEHLEYLQRSPHADWGPHVTEEATREAEAAGPDLVGVVLALHRHVGGAIRYEPGSTYVGVEVDEVLARRVGVCQDFAHLAVAMCRSIGIPARYVSGYLFTTSDATGENPEADVVRVQTHAWFEAAVPGVRMARARSDELLRGGSAPRHDRARAGLRRRASASGCLRRQGHAVARRQRRHPSLGAEECRGGRRRRAGARNRGGAAPTRRSACPTRSPGPASATGPAAVSSAGSAGGSLQP